MIISASSSFVASLKIKPLWGKSSVQTVCSLQLDRKEAAVVCVRNLGSKIGHDPEGMIGHGSGFWTPPPPPPDLLVVSRLENALMS